MSRLKHSPAGFLRSLQVSRFRIFGIVEGQDVDPCFYGGICKTVCRERGIDYQIRTARELPWHTGGKTAVLRFYQYVKSKSALISDLGGTTTGIIFFVDKDIDDLLRTKCRSNHVIHTKYYDIYNHLFRDGNLLTATASAAHIDQNEIEQHPLFTCDWCKTAACRWQEWVSICIVAKKSNSKTPGYRLTSRVNNPLNGPVDARKVHCYLRKVRHGTGMSPSGIKSLYDRTLIRVQKQFNNGDHDSVFKGKWYSCLIELDLKAAFSGRPLSMPGIAQRIPSTLMVTLDFNAPWSSYFTSAIKKVVDKL